MPEFSTVKNICDRIFALEAEHGLLDLEVDGVKFWQYLRMPVYYRIAQACGVLNDPHPAPIGLLARVRERFSNLKSILLHNPLYASGPLDALVFDHPRSTVLDGVPVDVYTHFLLQQLAEEGQRSLVVESPSHGLHLRKASRGRKHIDFVHLCHRVDQFLGRHACSPQGQQQIEWLNDLIHDSFSINIDLRPLFRDGVSRFHSNYKVYTRLLRRLQPKRIYVVVGYAYLGSLVKAAKDAGIEVVELQHGVFSRYHLGYSFPDRTTPLAYFPDKFLSWGRFWNELIDLPIPHQKVVGAGFPYFHHMRQLYDGYASVNNRVLVLSQGAISQALAERVLACVDELSEFELVYKLHPSEYARWKESPALRTLAQHANVQIVDHNADLYRLFAEAEYQVGVFSTAVYEGIGMGCKTVLVDLPGVEYMDQLITQEFAILFRLGDSMVSAFARADDIDVGSVAGELFNGEKYMSMCG
jgi:hypothetical protein